MRVAAIRGLGSWWLAVLAAGCVTVPPATPEGGSTGSDSSTSSTSGAATTVDPSTSDATTVSTTDASTTSTTTDGGSTTDAEGSSGDTGSSSTGTGEWMACPIVVEAFDGQPEGPWSYTKAESIDFMGGEAILTVSAAVDGNVMMVLPTGLVNALVRVDLGSVTPESGMLKMVRVRTPDGDIIAFRINVSATGMPRLEVYLAYAAGGDSVLAEVDYDPTNHRWLRIEELEGELTFSHGASDTAFTTMHTMETPVDLSMATVGIAAGNFDLLDQDVAVAFSHFEFVCN